MWHLNKIPKILYLYWGRNKPLSYMKYLTPVSFSNLNEDWKIIIFFPKESSNDLPWDSFEQKKYNYSEDIDYFNYLEKIKNVQLVEIDFKNDFNIKNISEVYKSDILRLFLIYKYGGVWSDFDIFYIKKMESLQLNNIKNKQYNSFVCIKDDFHRTGFLMGEANNELYKALFVTAINSYKKISSSYMCLGRDLFDFVIKKYKFNAVGNIKFSECVYPIEWNDLGLLFKENLKIGKNIGVHWFAGSDQISKIENIMNKNDIVLFQDKYLLREMSKCINTA